MASSSPAFKRSSRSFSLRGPPSPGCLRSRMLFRLAQTRTPTAGQIFLRSAKFFKLNSICVPPAGRSIHDAAEHATEVGDDPILDFRAINLASEQPLQRCDASVRDAARDDQ